MSQRLDALVLPTKLYPPPVPPDLVTREELTRRLESFRGMPLTLVCAPAGYGKSTLVSAWLRESQGGSAWLSLDPPDDDPTLFVTALVAAVRTVVPGACEDTLGLAGTEPAPSVEAVASAFCREVARLGESLVLVLDDYHVIQRADVHDFLTSVLTRPPPNLRLVIATRHDPPLPLAGLRARGHLGEVRATDLRFTDEEAARFFSNAVGESGAERALAHNRRAEGWPAALRLAAISLRQGREGDEPSTSPVAEYVRDYLLQEVLRVLDPQFREALLWTSPLDRLSVDLCRAVLGANGIGCDVDGGAFLTKAVHDNLFVIPLDDRGGWCRYHHLFQDLLMEELDRRHGPGAAARVYSAAADWFERHGPVEDALKHHAKLEDTAGVTRIVREYGRQLMDTERWSQLDRWLRLVPQDVLTGDPALLLLQAWSLENRFLMPEAMAVLDSAEQLLASDDRPERGRKALRVEVEALRSAFPYLEGNPDRSVPMASAALESLPLERWSERGYALVVLVLAQQMSGNPGRAVEAALEALGTPGIDGTTFQGRALIGLCFNHWLEADPRSLVQTARRALEVGIQSGLPETEEFARYFLGIGAYVTGDLEAAEEALSRGFSRFSANAATWIHATFALALVQQANGQEAAAWELSEGVVSHALEVQNAYQLEMAKAFQAELALRQGRPTEAARWAASTELRPSLHMIRFYLPETTYVRALLADGSESQVEKAGTFARATLEKVEQARNRRFSIEAHLMSALVELQLDRAQQARDHVLRAVQTAQPGGLIRPFLDLEDSLRPLVDVTEFPAKAVPFANRLRERLVAGSRASDSRGAVAAGAVGGRESASADGLHALRSPAASAAIDRLTDRELEILLMLADRPSNKEIAKRLFVSPETVKKHLSNLYPKLGVHGRREAVRTARDWGIL